MATLTSSTDFTIAAQSAEVATIDLDVLPVAASGTGRGRLVHPTFGTFDYPYQPKEWSNMDGDAIVPPDWQTSKTLTAGQATLWRGNMKDVRCTESWTTPGGLSMPRDMLRMLLSIYQNPPNPEDDYLKWYPSYITDLGFNVVMTRLTVGGSNIKFSDTSLQGWIDKTVTVSYQLVSYAE